MLVVEPSAKLIQYDDTNVKSILKHIEYCGRVCYNSADKITEDSYKSFVKGLVKSGHLSVLEHASMTFKMNEFAYSALKGVRLNGYFNNIVFSAHSDYRVSLNLRNIIEFNNCHINSALPDELAEVLGIEHNRVFNTVEWIETPSELKRPTVLMECNRGITHELVRHRTASFSQQSTRYCNYAGKEMRFINPRPFMNKYEYAVWENQMRAVEREYNSLVKSGTKPQIARDILPNSLATEIIVTANMPEWEHIFELRLDEVHAHPQMVQLMKIVKELF